MKVGYVAGPCIAAAAGFALGALAMYAFDPDNGKRRRTIAREKTVSTVNSAIESVESTARELRNRAKGVASETRRAFTPGRPDTSEPPSALPPSV